MIVCVSRVFLTEGRRNSDGTAGDDPELEITDGWYRLRAEVDKPLARAIRRGVIRAGRKIGVVDAKVHNSSACFLRLIHWRSVGFGPQGTFRNP
jgi:breast cancer 2 susceptibility protein